MKKIDLDTVEGYERKVARACNGFIDMLEKEKYELLSKYIKSDTKVTLKCNKGHIYPVIPNSFKRGNRCPICYDNGKSKIRVEFEDMLEKEGYKLLSEYTNGKKEVTLKCNKGHVYPSTPKRFKSGNRCPECVMKKTNKRLKKYNEEINQKARKEFIELVKKEGYELLGKYEGAFKKVALKCNKGHVYPAIPNNFKHNKQRCPYCCVKSHGEELVSKLLKQHGVCFNREKSFDGLLGLGGRSLRFDFYLPKQNVVIEINGEGHYKEYRGTFFNETTVEHDKIKRDFCKQQGIRLYNIEYLSTVIGMNNALKHVEERVLEVIGGMAA